MANLAYIGDNAKVDENFGNFLPYYNLRQCKSPNLSSWSVHKRIKWIIGKFFHIIWSIIQNLDIYSIKHRCKNYVLSSLSTTFWILTYNIYAYSVWIQRFLFISDSETSEVETTIMLTRFNNMLTTEESIKDLILRFLV